jgi:hypothetical protein
LQSNSSNAAVVVVDAVFIVVVVGVGSGYIVDVVC